MKRRLAAIEHDLQFRAEVDEEAQIHAYLANLQARLEALQDTLPQTPEELHQLFVLKKRMVDMLLMEATSDENREIHVKAISSNRNSLFSHISCTTKLTCTQV